VIFLPDTEPAATATCTKVPSSESSARYTRIQSPLEAGRSNWSFTSFVVAHHMYLGRAGSTYPDSVHQARP
jgi:hypothetical protein